MNIIKRITSPTPQFFRKVRAIGLAVATVGSSLLAACSVLPPVLAQIGAYLVVAGSIAAAVSQSATGEDEKAAKM